MIKRAKFSQRNLQLWFRIEVEHSLFAGIALFDTEAGPRDGYEKGYQVDEITEEMVSEASAYLDHQVLVLENWWLTWCYPNGMRQYRSSDEVPDFKSMNACAVNLIDESYRKQYVKKSVEAFEENLLKYLKV